jgi:hypothetical protein
MELHNLLAAVVEDMPDMPDQIPAVTRIVRRRRTAVRTMGVAAATALAVGAGALVVDGPWDRHATAAAPVPAVSGSASPHASANSPSGATAPASVPVPVPTATGPISLAHYPARVVTVLQALLPTGYRVAWAGAQYPTDEVSRYEVYQVTIGSRSYPISLDPMASSAGAVAAHGLDKCVTPYRGKRATCSATMLPGGTAVKVVRGLEQSGSKTDTLATVSLWHGPNGLLLNLMAGLGDKFTDAQLSALVQAPAYQQLLTAGLDNGLFAL